MWSSKISPLSLQWSWSSILQLYNVNVGCVSGEMFRVYKYSGKWDRSQSSRCFVCLVGLYTCCTTLPWQWSLITISQENHSLTHLIICSRLTTAASCLYSIRKWDGAPSTYNGHLTFDVAFNCNTLTRCVRLWLEGMTFKMCFVQSSPPLQTLPCEVSYVYQSVWRWTWFSHRRYYLGGGRSGEW